jgi:hypothetical protein
VFFLHLQRGAKETPLAVHEGEGFFLLDFSVAQRPHMGRVESDLLALGELVGVAERRVQ